MPRLKHFFFIDSGLLTLDMKVLRNFLLCFTVGVVKNFCIVNYNLAVIRSIVGFSFFCIYIYVYFLYVAHCSVIMGRSSWGNFCRMTIIYWCYLIIRICREKVAHPPKESKLLHKLFFFSLKNIISKHKIVDDFLLSVEVIYLSIILLIDYLYVNGRYLVTVNTLKASVRYTGRYVKGHILYWSGFKVLNELLAILLRFKSCFW